MPSLKLKAHGGGEGFDSACGVELAPMAWGQVVGRHDEVMRYVVRWFPLAIGQYSAYTRRLKRTRRPPPWLPNPSDSACICLVFGGDVGLFLV